MKNLILLFTLLGFAPSSFAGDFLDRFDAEETSPKTAIRNFWIGYGAYHVGNISRVIGNDAISRILPIETKEAARLLVSKESFSQSLSKLQKDLKKATKVLKRTRVDIAKYGSRAVYSHGYAISDSVKAAELQIENLNKAIKAKRLASAMNLQRLRRTKKVISAAHKALLAGNTDLGSGLKVTARQLGNYKKALRVTKIISVIGYGVSAYFISDLLFRTGILVFTDKCVGEKIPMIETSKYIAEKLESGWIKLFCEEDNIDELISLAAEENAITLKRAEELKELLEELNSELGTSIQ